MKLAIIDDNEKLAASLKNELMHVLKPDWVVTRTNGFEYLKELEQQPQSNHPELILMDISMRLRDEGILVTRLAKERLPDIKVVIFTINENDEFIFEAFKAGAVGYLLKNEPIDYICKVITETLHGGAFISPTIALKTIQFLSGSSHEVPQDKRFNEFELTVREIEILREIARGKKYQDVGERLSISVQTVKKHIGNIFTKLQVKNKVEALLKAKELLR